MPVRKLNQEKADALKAAYYEYDASKQPIVRLDAEGNEIVLRNHAEIAKVWMGISEQRYYELKNANWQLKRGTGKPPPPEPTVVSEATFATMYETFMKHIAKLNTRIAELESHIRDLEGTP